MKEEFTAQELEEIGMYQRDLRRALSDQSIDRFYLVGAFVVGLIAHILGYLLRPSAGDALLGLAVDLLYALGFALWTGVVITYFVQVLPEAKRRQIERALAAYEATQRKKE